MIVLVLTPMMPLCYWFLGATRERGAAVDGFKLLEGPEVEVLLTLFVIPSTPDGKKFLPFTPKL